MFWLSFLPLDWVIEWAFLWIVYWITSTESCDEYGHYYRAKCFHGGLLASWFRERQVIIVNYIFFMFCLAYARALFVFIQSLLAENAWIFVNVLAIVVAGMWLCRAVWFNHHLSWSFSCCRFLCFFRIQIEATTSSWFYLARPFLAWPHLRIAWSCSPHE